MKRLFVVFIVVVTAIWAGCAGREAPKYAKSSENIGETEANEQKVNLLKTVTHSEVWINLWCCNCS